MTYPIQVLTDAALVPAIVTFLQSKEAFDITMDDFRKRARERAVRESLTVPKRRFWYAADGATIIGAVGVGENERETDGYYLDYFAVHEKYRRQGLGRALIQTAEDYLRSVHARYLLIDTGDTDEFKDARMFYEACGYQPVSHIPAYYYPNEGRIDYYKKIS